MRQERRFNGTEKKTALRETERKAQEKVRSGKKTQILIKITAGIKITRPIFLFFILSYRFYRDKHRDYRGACSDNRYNPQNHRNHKKIIIIR